MEIEGFDFEPLNIDGLEVFMECCPVCRHFGMAIVDRTVDSLLLVCPACVAHLDKEERRISRDRRVQARGMARDRRRDSHGCSL